MPTKVQLIELLNKVSSEQEALAEENSRKAAEIDRMVEGMAELRMRLETVNWIKLSGDMYTDDANQGLDLATLRDISDDLRAHIVANALMKRITELRGNYIFGDGILYKNVTYAKKAIDDPKNQACLFSVEALLELNRAYVTDGNVFLLVNRRTKKIIRVPIGEITGYHRNPDDAEDIWYIKRTWDRQSDSKPEITTVDRWYKLDTAPAAANRKYILNAANQRIQVDQEWTMVHHSVNGQVGWPWGIPDLLASLQWAQKYSNYLKNQAEFAQSLSQIAVQYKAKTVDGAKTAQSVIDRPGVGASAVTGDFEINQLAGASAVDFDNGRALAAQAATAGEVSVLAALSDSGAASGSFGAAATLDTPQYKMVSARRNAISGFLKRVLRLLGSPNAEIDWPQLEDDALHRQITSILGLWNTGLFEPEEIREKLVELADMLGDGTIPEGVMIPNNVNSLNRRDVDTDSSSTGNTQTPVEPPNDFTNTRGRDNLGLGNIDAGNNELRDEE